MIGILGGTFDPPHLAHLKIADYLLNALSLEKIIFIPCYFPVLKQAPYANPEHRLAMVNLMIEDNPRLQLDDREIKNARPSYTIDTLKSIHQETYNTPLAFIMGSDAFNQFSDWKDWRGILALCHIVVVNRAGHELNQKLINSCKPKVFFYDFLEMNIASRDLRQEITRNIESVKDKLPLKVWDYINKNALYRKILCI